MKKTVLIPFLLFAAITFSAEDATDGTPPRLGPAIGIINTPLAVGYRLSMLEFRSVDLMLRVPEFYKNETGGVGFELGGLVGYNLPLLIEENLAFVIKPQLDLAFSTEDIELGNDEYSVNTFSLRPGAFIGLEIFLEEVGVSNVNIALGFTAGAEFDIVNSKYFDAKSTFHIPMATSPFGAIVGVWWYF